MVELNMNDEFERICEEASRDLIDVHSRHLGGGTEENNENYRSGLTVFRPFRTDHLPNTSRPMQRF
jgi:hypothetical protein